MSYCNSSTYADEGQLDGPKYIYRDKATSLVVFFFAVFLIFITVDPSCRGPPCCSLDSENVPAMANFTYFPSSVTA